MAKIKRKPIQSTPVIKAEPKPFVLSETKQLILRHWLNGKKLGLDEFRPLAKEKALPGLNLILQLNGLAKIFRICIKRCQERP